MGSKAMEEDRNKTNAYQQRQGLGRGVEKGLETEDRARARARERERNQRLVLGIY